MLQGLTAHYLVNSTYAAGPGDVALVHAAAGGVGQLLVQLLVARAAPSSRPPGRTRSARSQGNSGRPTRSTTRTTPGRRTWPAAVREAAGEAWTSSTTAWARRPSTPRSRRFDRAGSWCCSAGRAARCRPSTCSGSNSGGSLFVTRPKLADYIAEREELEWRAREVFAAIADGSLKIERRRALLLRRGRRCLRGAGGPTKHGQAGRRPRAGPRGMSRTLLRHKRIWTGDPSSPWTDALLVEDGCVMAVGADALDGDAARSSTCRARSSCRACTTPTSTPSGSPATSRRSTCARHARSTRRSG